MAGTEFEKIRHLILYDYAVHWFDMVNCLFTPRTALRVYASASRSPWQTIMPPLQAQTVVEFDRAQASLAFDGSTQFASQDRTYVTGSTGTLLSVGSGNREQHVTLTTASGAFSPRLTGCWFPDGFHGTMGELLCSIEQNRTPSIDAPGTSTASHSALPPSPAPTHTSLLSPERSVGCLFDRLPREIGAWTPAMLPRHS